MSYFSCAVPLSDFHHIPVLPTESIAALNLQPGGYYLDATIGGGGHSRLILEHDPTVKLVGLDQDAMAIAAAQQTLAPFADRVTLRQMNFATLRPGKVRFAGILADLGVSSAQFDQGDRGFSFRHSAPLDMRMDQRQTLTAAELINTRDEAELADIFYTYGEERLSRQIARAIVEQRPIETTTQLADVIWHSVPTGYRNGRIHPATRVFQGLRIAVNQELTMLEQFLDRAVDWLIPGGRIAILSFHSLEDRIVKHRLRENEQLTIITRKPICATPEETAQNPRARSAKLRVAEKHI